MKRYLCVILVSFHSYCDRSSQALQQGPLISRRHVVANSVGAAAGVLVVASTSPTPAAAAAETKLLHLDKDKLKEIVLKDITQYSFLTTGKITRAIYDESATFQDEIDTYGLDQWIQGTSRLFVGEGSDLRLIGDVHVSDEQVEFRFDEDLMFNIPFRPKVHLTGRLVLERDPNTGLIIKYREYWDQDVWSVLKSATR